ncbi:MAG: chromosome condensation regulator RCC1, partial [Bdellovibrionota bacterium]
VAGWGHTCAIDDTGTICWGAHEGNDLGQTRVPVGLKNVKSIAAGGGHSCALDEQGVKCWGSNSQGQIYQPPTGK